MLEPEVELLLPRHNLMPTPYSNFVRINNNIKLIKYFSTVLTTQFPVKVLFSHLYLVLLPWSQPCSLLLVLASSSVFPTASILLAPELLFLLVLVLMVELSQQLML